MDYYGHEDITYVPRNPDDRSDYCPVLYQPMPNSIQLIPAYVRELSSLTPRSSSEQSQQISQRNIALVQRRIDAVGDLDPQRILKCYGYRFGDKPCMIVARDGKESLARLIARGDLNPLERLELLYEAGKAIQYLHSKSPPVVHGGVHPKTILIARPNSAVLSDFGLPNVWRLLELDSGFAHPAIDEAWLGPLAGAKVGYTAPEYILDEEEEMLPPADIYAFASVILAVLSSRHPFSGVSISSAKGIAAIVHGVPPDPEDHPNLSKDDPLWPLLQRMWSRNPGDRPTIDEVMKQLNQELKIRGGEAVTNIIGLEDVGGYPTCDQVNAESSA
ncbi:hypothetical protein M407DRAFT_34239 [Tulasnella calospora MUT 4182]|uniref:Protein kinase domain-containing protein n=1 Tax=Tulasnella calospora MUT 4182 TaxID=1051891 RepID=A0A0C3K3X4_9AGAM|nr:hypothetical protein M407DRAFT_34239 [Tulasnella calospora MUT 4182]